MTTEILVAAALFGVFWGGSIFVEWATKRTWRKPPPGPKL